MKPIKGNRHGTGTFIIAALKKVPVPFTRHGCPQLNSAGGTIYNYDPDGNQLGSVLGPNNEVLSFGPDTYTYNAAGEELTDTNGGNTWTYGYNNDGNMVSANETGLTTESIVYKYDVFGNLIDEDITPGGGPTTILEYALDDWNPAKMGSLGNSASDTWAVIDGSTGILQWENVDGSGINQHLFAVSNTAAIVNLLLTDRQESMRGTFSGGVVTTTDYDAFGNVISGAPGEFGYAGYRYDAAPTGLYLDNARVYDPSSQRWTTQDPMGFDAGDSNLYRYVNNAATNATDPSGFQTTGYERNRDRLDEKAAQGAGGGGAQTKTSGYTLKARSCLFCARPSTA
jgi:RHS repeat-associated protein